MGFYGDSGNFGNSSKNFEERYKQNLALEKDIIKIKMNRHINYFLGGLQDLWLTLRAVWSIAKFIGLLFVTFVLIAVPIILGQLVSPWYFGLLISWVVWMIYWLGRLGRQ